MPARTRDICQVGLLTWAVGLLLLSTNAGAVAGLPDSYVFGLWKEIDRAGWVVDSELDDRINTEFAALNPTQGDFDLVLNETDTERLVDLCLQNIFSASRVEAGARVIGVEQCDDNDFDNTPCVVAHSNSEDTRCGDGDIAFAGCDVFGCNVVLCLENWSFQSLKTLPLLLSHELGHIYGLSHPDSHPPSSSNDGICDGELMCRVGQESASMFTTDGDNRGFRAAYGGPFQSEEVHERLVFFDADTGGLNAPNWTESFISVGARFQPRVACAKSSNPTNDCVMVVTSNDNDRVIRLDNPTGETWATQSTVMNHPTISDMAPDIAINPDGTIAYIVRTTAAQSVFVTRVPLDGSTPTTISLSEESFRPVLPPRIAWHNGFLQVVAWVEDPTTLVEGEPTWAFRTVNAAATSVVQYEFAPMAGGINLTAGAWGDLNRTMTEFDFDCSEPPYLGAAVVCTLVAQIFRPEMDYTLSSIQSFRFYSGFNPQNFSTYGVVALDTDWEISAQYAANRVSSVVLTDSHLYVAHGRLLTSGTDTSNYRIRKIAGTSVTGTLVDHEPANLDGSPCSSTNNLYGDDMPPATTHGGISFGYCEGCFSGGVMNVSWGRRVDNNAFCH